MARSFHFGVDYGTSASKLVVRHYDAPGGDLAEIVPSGKEVRHPATIVLARGKLHFGDKADEAATDGRVVRYESVKMRVAAEATGDPTYCFAPCPPLPDGLSAHGLAILSVWWLLTTAHRHVVENVLGAKRWFRTPEYKALVTLGIPTSFFVNPLLRRRFWDVLEGARHLQATYGNAGHTFSVEDASRFANEALRAAAEQPLEKDDYELRRVLRPEAEAALWWAIQSPAVPAGPYIKLDVGAGTTNVSLFRMTQAWSPGSGFQQNKDRLCFFGAASVASGMDEIDAALNTVFGRDASSPVAFRGREANLLESDAAVSACGRALEHLYAAVRKASQMARKHINELPEKAAWVELDRRPGQPPSPWRRTVRVVPLGGGCLVEEIRNRLARYPAAPDDLLPALDLEPPSDLRFDGRPVPKRLLAFAAVSYGLANLDPVIAQWPEQIEPLAPAKARRPLSHEELYST